MGFKTSQTRTNTYDYRYILLIYDEISYKMTHWMVNGCQKDL